MKEDIFEPRGGTLLSAHNFEILRSLGQGAAGEVFLARALQDGGKEVALKVLKNPDAFDELTLSRFRTEVQVLRSLNHPNIIRAYDLFDYKGCLAYSMEYVKGKDLSRIIFDTKLTTEQIDNIMLQVLDAIHELHANNIIHRDLKLENILLGEDGYIKVSDLGLIKRADSQGATRPGLILGTAQYMPPEYIKKGYYDIRGDIYALGVILLELLVSKRRLSGVADNKAMEYIIRSKFEISAELLGEVPRGYRAIVEKATAVDPKKRYRNALEMRRDIIKNHGSLGTSSSDSQIGSDGFDNQPLLGWKAVERKRRPLWQIALFGVAISIVMVIGWASFPSIKPRVIISLGEYHGIARVGGSKLVPLEFLVDPTGIKISSQSLQCHNQTLDVRKRLFSCAKAQYRFEVEAALDNQFRGYILKFGSAEVIEFQVAKTG